jgi:3-methyladenine DNA glycosylase/8-oxoguanine DNA glycosylase
VRAVDLPLAGAGGEPVDLWRTLQSHGLVELPPMQIDAEARSLDVTLRIEGVGPRMVRVTYGRKGFARVEIGGAEKLSAAATSRLLLAVGHILRLDEDLSPFYEQARSDPDLAWAIRGAGRMVRSQTVFEEVVKTVCTTNCAWSATERMVGALVEHLGESAPGAPATGPFGRAFPTAEAMAEADESFYRETARAGYRGAYLRSLSSSVANGSVDLEELGRATPEDLSDDEIEARLLTLPGVGPYAAAHIMMMLGRYSRLILDSWTRPKYAAVTGGRPKKDTTIVRRFRRYGPYAGLAFWLVLTRDWVEEDEVAPPLPA